jgi:hypothetical protein
MASPERALCVRETGIAHHGDDVEVAVRAAAKKRGGS